MQDLAIDCYEGNKLLQSVLCFNNALGKNNRYLKDLSAGEIYIA